jgi:hypothetical protein
MWNLKTTISALLNNKIPYHTSKARMDIYNIYPDNYNALCKHVLYNIVNTPLMSFIRPIVDTNRAELKLEVFSRNNIQLELGEDKHFDNIVYYFDNYIVKNDGYVYDTENVKTSIERVFRSQDIITCHTKTDTMYYFGTETGTIIETNLVDIMLYHEPISTVNIYGLQIKDDYLYVRHSGYDGLVVIAINNIVNNLEYIEDSINKFFKKFHNILYWQRNDYFILDQDNSVIGERPFLNTQDGSIVASAELVTEYATYLYLFSLLGQVSYISNSNKVLRVTNNLGIGNIRNVFSFKSYILLENVNHILRVYDGGFLSNQIINLPYEKVTGHYSNDNLLLAFETMIKTLFIPDWGTYTKLDNLYKYIDYCKNLEFRDIEIDLINSEIPEEIILVIEHYYNNINDETRLLTLFTIFIILCKKFEGV